MIDIILALAFFGIVLLIFPVVVIAGMKYVDWLDKMFNKK